MVTDTINPEYGRNSGAIMNAAIKSGTNHFHGSGFDFYRDTFLNTRDYFTGSARGVPPEPVWRNDWRPNLERPHILLLLLSGIAIPAASSLRPEHVVFGSPARG